MTLNQNKNHVIIASLKSETMGKLINRIPGECLLISSLPGSALRTHVESLGKPGDSTSVLKALPGTLYIKRYSPSILYLACHLLSCQRASQQDNVVPKAIF